MTPTLNVPGRLIRAQWVRLVAFVGMLILAVLILIRIENILLSALVAFTINFLLEPPVAALTRAGVKRSISIAICFLIAGFVLTVALIGILPFVSEQIVSLRLEVPKYILGAGQMISTIEGRIQDFTGQGTGIELAGSVRRLLTEWTSALFDDLPDIISRSFTTLLLAPFFAFFMLKDGRNLIRWLFSIVPNNFFELSVSLYHQINLQMGQFIRAKLIEAVIVGIVTWVGLASIHFPYSFLLACFAAITNLIPYVGPLVGFAPALLIGLVNSLGEFQMLGMLIVYGVAQAIDTFVIIPLVVAKIVNLHPVTVMIAIIIGAQLLGVIGMLISIPVASVLKVTISSVYNHLIGVHPARVD